MITKLAGKLKILVSANACKPSIDTNLTSECGLQAELRQVTFVEIKRARSANPTYSGWAIPVTLPEQRNARAAARRYG